MSGLVSQYVALALAVATLLVGFAALTARSLFVMCMYLAAAGALGAAAVLAIGAGDAALAVALFAAVWAPLLLLAGMLLSARAAKSVRRGLPWASLAAGAMAAGVVLVAAPELGQAPVSVAYAGGLGAWLAPLLFVAAAVCVGLLGYGERGALQRHAEPEL